ncbi:molybdenum cofactor guanylyltransferase [Metabacillus arenae]|uniref:Probable molybdenum cofactor guanylyltransferase n=1 Tax=Metabacillus arenae TaxID=2771434 RepID=A0A926NHL7_9BACI|nr:molybdenum cofactor guanylyltransferase [Metabacillus arenae]MBD1381774.1 molybdenum cofactor guanylyltransferase [Metabacillus arenae]
MSIAGIVLAGGKSSRYGTPKMFETYKGKHLYEYSVDALRENRLSPIIISTNSELRPCFKRTDVHYIIENELEAHQGPLFALYNVISNEQKAEWFFVLSCDIPFVTSCFVREIIAIAKGTHSFDVILPTQSGRDQPLLALYHRRSLSKMKQTLSSNKRSLRVLLNELNVRTVPFSRDENIFININYKEDWH